MAEHFSQALQQVFGDPFIWLVILGAACYGLIVGAIPGLTATMAVALLVPVTFWLDPVPALAAIVTMAACAIFAGDIPTTLLRIPGTPASAAYADDAYRLTQAGRSRAVLSTALVCSVAGGIFGAVVLMLLGQWLARVATWFSAAEYFWLYVMGLSCAVVVSRQSALKATLGTLIGLLLSTVGLSAVHSQARFTFGIPQLYQGIAFIPAMIGLFGVSEVINNLCQGLTADEDLSGEETSQRRTAAVRVGLLRPGFRTLIRRPLQALRSSTIGAVIGMLPGAGADIGAWVSLAVSKSRRAKSPDRPTDAETAISGIADATAANNSALAGSWIPTLVFGIPGDSITAIVIGVMLMKNVRPGPEIFFEQPVLVYSIYLIFLLANLVLLPAGAIAIALGTRLVRIPKPVLLPMILLFCVVGSYSLNGSTFDIWVMLVMGVMGWWLERRRVPLGPIVLGIILGGPLEERFIQTITGSQGSLWGLVERPMAAVLACVCLFVWGLTITRNWTRKGGQESST